MEPDTILQSQEEIEVLLKKALKNIEHAHMDAIIAIEEELKNQPKEGSEESRLQALKESLT